ncbi:pentapeptide repeat-containing protein [Thioalkalivibrio halophilus]|uniref:GYF domain-containing protein n=1 Tax=Thioalkalivibrio halophilus TaxID=252474 RepID=A0A1V2ZVD3_9GAMM|nr:pentapeptide repeat-containing protein [Thioalkalivibrio halophilus]OOC09006.1 hypothetical protein B1A74_13250 [Thioalkalivibrio halophilus]
MSDEPGETPERDSEGYELWYTRRDGEVHGPFPAHLIRRYLILGRLTPDDEVGPTPHLWYPLREVPELIPEELLHADTPEGLERLQQARLREDERLRERRAPDEDTPPELLERREGERRRPESPETVTHRQQWAELLTLPARHVPAILRGPRRWITLGVTLVVAILLLWLLREPPPETPARDCSSPPAPEVNWNRCEMPVADLREADLTRASLREARLPGARLQGARLDGALLEFADLTHASLADAHLTDARLRGATLRGTDLTGTDFSGADLRHADLREANPQDADLSGARLGRALWPDGSRCPPEAVGTCE